MKKKSKKRAYRTPRIRTEKIYERYGLACGKQTIAQQQCQGQFKS